MISQAKDVTSTTFGLVIAYLLPGFIGLYVLSFWSSRAHDLLHAFVSDQITIGRSLAVIFGSLVIGLELSAVRFYVFEKLICRKINRGGCDFSSLAVEPKFAAFRGAVDEFLRYHQFWSGMALTVPFVAWHVIPMFVGCKAWALAVAFVLLEALNVSAAYSAFKNYIDTAAKILSKNTNG